MRLNLYIIYSFLFLPLHPKRGDRNAKRIKTVPVDDDGKLRFVCQICDGTGIVTGNKQVCVRRLPDVDVERDCYRCDWMKICREEIEKKCPACGEKKFRIIDTNVWGPLKPRSDPHA